jgi:hypothetical protein
MNDPLCMQIIKPTQYLGVTEWEDIIGIEGKLILKRKRMTTECAMYESKKNRKHTSDRSSLSCEFFGIQLLSMHQQLLVKMFKRRPRASSKYQHNAPG